MFVCDVEVVNGFVLSFLCSALSIFISSLPLCFFVASFSILLFNTCIKARIKRIRDKEGQLAFKVPESALNGHAFHTYTLRYLRITAVESTH